jgi:hypothetical protein
MTFIRGVSLAYRSWLNRLAQSYPRQARRGHVALAAIVVGGFVAAGVVSNSSYRGTIRQLADGSIDVTVIDPLPDSVAIPAACHFDILAPRHHLLVLASSASSVDALTNIDTLTDIDTLTT